MRSSSNQEYSFLVFKLCGWFTMNKPSQGYVAFMERYIDQEYAPVSQHGYSCQTLLARQINELIHSGNYYCWFATSLDSFENGDDSNPILIYVTIDRAIKQKGANNAKIKDVRLNLMRAVKKELRKQQRHEEIASTQSVIAKAPLTWLRPEIWRIDLKAIQGSYTAGHQYKDEFLICNLTKKEFEIIVE